MQLIPGYFQTVPWPSHAQYSQCTYNLTVRRVRATVVVVGKVMIVTHCKCVFVALGIQQAMRMRRIVICGLLRYTTFLHIIS